MATFRKIVKVKSLGEAFDLNQKRLNIIIGGYMWLKMSHQSFDTGIDLSHLELDKIIEKETSFQVGAMCSLRSLETNVSLNTYFDNGISAALHSIVGIQFRNGATVGGSLYGRYGFSDLLTCLMVLDTSVVLFHRGILSLPDFASLNYDNDLLIQLIINKDSSYLSYQSHHHSITDFPVINVAVSKKNDCYKIAVGSRPMRASLLETKDPFDSKLPACDELENFSKWAADQFTYGNNLRASALYRKHLASVYIKRAIKEILNSERTT